MSGLKIKKGDKVQVLVGKDRGKQGVVLVVRPTTSKILVSGINICKRHLKQTKTLAAGIYEKESYLPISNVAMVDPKLSVPTKVGYKMVDGKKVRYAKKSGEVINNLD